VIGAIEFEYWAENVVLYSNVLWYTAAMAIGISVFIALFINIILSGSIGERLNEQQPSIWRLKYKSKDYLKENAPKVLEFVKLA
jgi:hypothetical protein